MMGPVVVFGCTGAVGSKILATLLATDSIPFLQTISRRAPNGQSQKLKAYQETDSSKGGDMISNLEPKPDALLHALGTTRATAGSIENQWKIDHDLCIETAKAAKAAGVNTYVSCPASGPEDLRGDTLPMEK